MNSFAIPNALDSIGQAIEIRQPVSIGICFDLWCQNMSTCFKHFQHLTIRIDIHNRKIGWIVRLDLISGMVAAQPVPDFSEVLMDSLKCRW